MLSLFLLVRSRPLALPCLALVAGLSVTGFLTPWYHYFANMKCSLMLDYNPFYWNPFKPEMFDWHPPWLNLYNQIVSCLALPLLDIRAITHLLIGPWDWIDRTTYQGLSSFTTF